MPINFMPHERMTLQIPPGPTSHFRFAPTCPKPQNSNFQKEKKRKIKIQGKDLL
jgi:hypothetical protein